MRATNRPKAGPDSSRVVVSASLRRRVTALQALVLLALLVLIEPRAPVFDSDAAAVRNTSDVAPRAESRSHEEGLLAAGSADPEEAWFAAVRRQLTLREYRANRNAEGLQAPSRRHAFRTYFEPTGIRVVDRIAEDAPQLLALRLQQVGRANSMVPLAPGEVASAGARVEIRRGSVLEWYVNSPAGLEQGFTLSKRAEGEGPLVLDLSLEGAEASWSGQSVRIATATGRRLSYGELQAVDAAGVPLPVELSLPSARRIQLRVDDTAAVYPIMIDPLLAAVEGALLESNQQGALFGFSSSGAGDVNGDGYDDVIVGAWRYDAGETDEGAAFIFHGSANGIADATPTAAHTRLEGDQAGAEMGEYVASAGDVDGDGYDDVIVGAWHYDAGDIDEGAAFIFHGSANGIADGNPAAANTRIESDQASAEMGLALGSAGDVNGDGYDDVIVGAWHYDAGETDEGAAFIFHGSPEGIANGTPATAQTRFTGEQAGAQMGISVAGAGDVNGDGYADVVVGAHTLDASETDEGAAFLFLGSASGIADATPASAAARFESNQAGAWMGVNVDGAGDVNGDGYADVIVGARLYDAGETDEGVAFIFHGSAAGIADGTPATAQTRLAGDQAGAWMGHSVAGAGDVNGDGYADVIVGAGRYDAGAKDTGAVFLFLGSASGIPDAGSAGADAGFENDQENAHMGYGGAGAGDVNGDGYADFIIGVPNYNCGLMNEGVAVVFLGGDVTAPGQAGQKIGMPGGGCGGVLEFPGTRNGAAAFMVVLLIIAGVGLLVTRLRRRTS